MSFEEAPYCLKVPETCAFISANVAVKSTLFSLYTEVREGMKMGWTGVCGWAVVWEDVPAPRELLPLFLTGDSRWPRKLEREKSLTSLLSHCVSVCCRRRDGEDGGDMGALESWGKPASPSPVDIVSPPPPPLSVPGRAHDPVSNVA